MIYFKKSRKKSDVGFVEVFTQLNGESKKTNNDLNVKIVKFGIIDK